jgi:hypothetical protein
MLLTHLIITPSVPSFNFPTDCLPLLILLFIALMRVLLAVSPVGNPADALVFLSPLIQQEDEVTLRVHVLQSPPDCARECSLPEVFPRFVVRGTTEQRHVVHDVRGAQLG